MADGMSYDEWKRRQRLRSGHPTTRKVGVKPTDKGLNDGGLSAKLRVPSGPGTSRQQGAMVSGSQVRGSYTPRSKMKDVPVSQRKRGYSQIEDRRKPQGVPGAVKYSGSSAAHPKPKRTNVSAAKPKVNTVKVLARKTATTQAVSLAHNRAKMKAAKFG